MFIPDSIYRVQPLACAVTGLFVATNMEHSIGVGAGILLILAGAYVWKMRFDYQREIEARKVRRKQRVSPIRFG